MTNVNKVKVSSGTLTSRKRGKNYSDLQEALNDLAKCCGVDCCDGVIRLTDQVTGTLKKISIQDGVLVVEDNA